MSAENVEAIRRVYEGMARGDFWAAREVFDPKIVWEWTASLSGLTGVPEYRGIEGVEAATRDFFKVWDSYKQEASELIDAGDDVVAKVHGHGRPKGSGREVEFVGGNVWTFRDGKAVRFKAYDTLAEAFEAAGLADNRAAD